MLTAAIVLSFFGNSLSVLAFGELETSIGVILPIADAIARLEDFKDVWRRGNFDPVEDLELSMVLDGAIRRLSQFKPTRQKRFILPILGGIKLVEALVNPVVEVPPNPSGRRVQSDNVDSPFGLQPDEWRELLASLKDLADRRPSNLKVFEGQREKVKMLRPLSVFVLNYNSRNKLDTAFCQQNRNIVFVLPVTPFSVPAWKRYRRLQGPIRRP